MELSKQTIVLIVVYLICIFVGFISSIVKKQFDLKLVLGSLLSLLFLTLFAYDTNCLTKGDCNGWSWFRTILYILVPILALVSYIISLFQKKSNVTSEETVYKI